MAIRRYLILICLFLPIAASAHAKSVEEILEEIRGCMTVDTATEVAMLPPSAVNLPCFADNEKTFREYFYKRKDFFKNKIWAGYGLAALYDSRKQYDEAARARKRVQILIKVENLADDYSEKTGESDQTSIRLYLLEQVRDEDLSGEIAAMRQFERNKINPTPQWVTIFNGALQGLSVSTPAPPPQQTQNYPVMSTSAPENVGRSACRPMSQFVSVEVRSMNGPGHCPGEVDAWLTNKGDAVLTCQVMFHHDGSFSGAGSQFDLAPGQTLGGFSGGLWTCQSDRSDARHMCYAKAESSAPGSTCWAVGNINWNY